MTAIRLLFVGSPCESPENSWSRAICTIMTGVERRALTTRPAADEVLPSRISLRTKNWKEAVKVMTQTVLPTGAPRLRIRMGASVSCQVHHRNLAPEKWIHRFCVTTVHERSISIFTRRPMCNVSFNGIRAARRGRKEGWPLKTHHFLYRQKRSGERGVGRVKMPGISPTFFGLSPKRGLSPSQPPPSEPWRVRS